MVPAGPRGLRVLVATTFCSAVVHEAEGRSGGRHPHPGRPERVLHPRHDLGRAVGGAAAGHAGALGVGPEEVAFSRTLENESDCT